MTKVNFLLLTVALILIFAGCKAQSSHNIKSYYSDTAIFSIDTTINHVLIDGKQFSLKVLRDRYDEHLDEFSKDGELLFEQSPITVILTDDADGKVVYLKKFDFAPNDYPYLNYSFHKGQAQRLNDTGKLYLMLNKGYGGSGSQSITYYISFQGNKITFSNLFTTSGELSYIAYNKNDNQMIVLDGIWNMKENESHFANHRYTMTVYTYRDNSFDKKIIGQTKFKYSILDDKKPVVQLLSEIKIKEPSLLKGIQLADFE